MLLANVFLGIYYNQSIWYKLSGQTKFGAYIAIGGAAITIAVNVVFIPLYGYWASAWATLVVYALQMVASYLLGQKYYPIKYNLRKFALYLGLALFLFGVSRAMDSDPHDFTVPKFFMHNGLILFFIFVIWFIEKGPKKRNKLLIE